MRMTMPYGSPKVRLPGRCPSRTSSGLVQHDFPVLLPRYWELFQRNLSLGSHFEYNIGQQFPSRIIYVHVRSCRQLHDETMDVPCNYPPF
jgi:hypothetical protein